MKTLKELTAEEDMGGYIKPKEDCIHVRRIMKTPPSLEQALLLFEKKCGGCEEKEEEKKGKKGKKGEREEKENWLCLECGEVFCGRYVKGHMVEHSQKRGHRVCFSFFLSFFFFFFFFFSLFLSLFFFSYSPFSILSHFNHFPFRCVFLFLT